MAVSRIQISSNKKAALLKQNMREVAVMLSEDPPKEEKARIRAEALIRDDNLIEAFEILQLQCELLFERIKLIECSKQCPTDLVPVVATLIYASQRVDIPELMEIRKQFRAKFGKKFEEVALENSTGILNERVVTKLSVDPPAAYLVQTYLERICEQYEVKWKPKMTLTAAQMAAPMAVPIGYSVPVAQGTGLGVGMPAVLGTYSPEEDLHYLKMNGGVPPPIVTATNVEPYPPTNPMNNNSNNMNDIPPSHGEAEFYIPPNAPSAPPGGTPRKDDDDDDTKPSSGGGGESGTYADLAARFNQLKK
jgi:hypothetical protein